MTDKSCHSTQCSHEDVLDNICVTCGLYMTTYGISLDLNENYSRSHSRYKKNKDITFFRRLKSTTCIPESVKLWIFEQIESSPNFKENIKSRDQTLYAYAYQGHLVLNIPFDPLKLASDLGISKSDTRIGTKLSAGIASRSLPESINGVVKSSLDVKEPDFYLRDPLEAIGYIDLLEEITIFSKEITSINQNLLEEKPNKVAIGIINYYITKKNIVIDKIHKMFKMTPKELRLYTELISCSIE